MSSIDKYRVDITSLKSELTLLSRKRAQLASRLAYLKSSKAVFSIPGLEATQSLMSDELLERDRERGKLLLSHLSEKYDEQQNIHLQNLYRLTGVTAFKVRDPSANGKGDLLGIRIECFALKKFGAPHYILLSVNGKTNSYDIYKYTVPLHIPLASLAKKYLHKDLGRLFWMSINEPIYRVSRMWLPLKPTMPASWLSWSSPFLNMAHALLICDATWLIFRAQLSRNLFKSGLMTQIWIMNSKTRKQRLCAMRS
ncbi:hypothetical protein V1515DRAFT_43716 [Lipomyces mesembrius]